MDNNTEVKIEHLPGSSDYGPYYGAREGRTFTTGGHVFHIFIYEAYNAMGLIGTEYNGIAMCSVTDTQVVFDGWYRRGMGNDHMDAKLAELLSIVEMTAPDLKAFLSDMNNHGHHCRYNPLRDLKPQARAAKKLDAGIAKNHTYVDEQFMTAKLKARTARDFELFIIARLNIEPEEVKETEYGCLYKPFRKSVYNHFHLHLGYIAHFNRAGFYDAQFSTNADFYKNIARLAHGDFRSQYIHRDYWDLNSVMHEVAKHYLPRVQALLEAEQKEEHQQSIAAARALLEREGMTVNG